jgi:hypothetical protein
MDCHFCSVAPAAHFRVPTFYGIVAGLCRPCYAQYARVLRQPGLSTRELPCRTKSSAIQLRLPFSNETSGPTTAARSN